MYTVHADGTLIYDSTLEDYKIAKGLVTRETDKAGSFNFALYSDHFFYDSIVKMRTLIMVRKSGKVVFRGRVANDEVDYQNKKVCTCAGELSFLQDSVIRPYALSGTPEEIFTYFIEEHNAQVEEAKQFKVGMVTVTDPNGYIARSNTAYESTLANLQSRLLEDQTGGHIYITHGADGTDPMPTIHYLADFPKTSSQSIEFGENLKDFVKKGDASGIATAIIPLGATIDDGDSDTEDPRLTIARVNNGKDYVYSPTGVSLYGWIIKPVEWDDVTDASILKAEAEEYVETAFNTSITVELTALDLHLLDRSIESYNVCEYIPVNSAPHNFSAVLLCNKQTLDLLNPDNDTVILGRTYYTFTEAGLKTKAAASYVKVVVSEQVSHISATAAKALKEAEAVSLRVIALEEAGTVLLKSTTEGSTKQFRLTVDDTGMLTTTEVTTDENI
jgi:hypothetical protein